MTDEQQPVFDMSYITERCTLDPVTGCWNWNKGYASHGYGQAHALDANGNRTIGVTAPRYSYYLYYGSWPEFACHKCNNRACANPEHLYSGNSQSNIADKVAAGAQTKGEEVHSAKLTGADVLLIRKLFATGKYFQRELAEAFGVTESTMSSLLRSKTWKHLL